jgi:hypothetical protein
MKKLLLIVILTFVVLSCKKGTETEEVKDEIVEFEFMEGKDKNYFFQNNDKLPFGILRNIVSSEDDTIINLILGSDTIFYKKNIIHDINYLLIRDSKEYDSLNTKLKKDNIYKVNLLTNSINVSKKDSLDKYLKNRNQFLIIVYQESGFVVNNDDNCKECLNNLTEKLTLGKINNNLEINITHRYHYRYGRGLLTPNNKEYALLLDNKYKYLLQNIIYNQREVYFEDPK